MSLRIGEPVAKFIGDELRGWHEWNVPVFTQASIGGWQVIDVGLSDLFNATFGTEGWSPVNLLGVRLRGALDVARIEVDPLRLHDLFPGSWWWSWSGTDESSEPGPGRVFEIGRFSEDDTYVQEYTSYEPQRAELERRPVLGPVRVRGESVSWQMFRPADNWLWNMQWHLHPGGREFSGICNERIGIRRVRGRRLEPGEAERIIQEHRASP